MSLRSTPALFVTCVAMLAGCPGEDPPEVSTESGTTSDGATTMVTPPMTTEPMTTEPGTTEPGTTSTGVDGTTVVLDDTSTSEPATDSTSGGSTDETTGTGSTTGEPLACGNGMIDMGEDCDGADVGAATCLDQGFDDGVIACDPAACTFDVSGCFFVEALQNDNGMCMANELGCTDAMGTAGNPQDMLECFETTLTPPIDVISVEYSIGDSVPLPGSADLIIHEWAGPGNLPGMLVDQIPLDPLTDIVAGFYTFVLPTPSNVTTAGFCVGFHGEDAADGFRVDFTDVSNAGESFLQANLCGLATFTELTALAPGDYCIRPTVTSPNP